MKWLRRVGVPAAFNPVLDRALRCSLYCVGLSRPLLSGREIRRDIESTVPAIRFGECAASRAFGSYRTTST
jgi:hypothetical protein